MAKARQRIIVGSVAIFVVILLALSHYHDKPFLFSEHEFDPKRSIIGSKSFANKLQECFQLVNRELIPLPPGSGNRKMTTLTTAIQPPLEPKSKTPLKWVPAENISVTTSLQDNSYSHQNLEKPVNVSERFDARRKRLREVCHKLSPIPWKNMPNYYDEFAYKRLIFCRIPKVGTTFMIYFQREVFNYTFGGYDKSILLSAIPRKTFFIVREPYARLVAGYVCKIVLTGSWWSTYGRYIVESFRNDHHDHHDHHSGNGTTCGNDVTFPEFVRYFIHSQETGVMKNTHWSPIHEQCLMCQVNYDYILHLETFTDDFRFLLQSVNVSADTIFDFKEREIKGKSKDVILYRANVEHCEPLCATLRKAWWSFKLRGFISKDLDFPLDEKNCSAITPEDFERVTWDAHQHSVGLMNARKQKRDAVVELYLQIPLEDRLKLKDIFQTDFNMFGYDPMPADLFPEFDLYKNQDKGDPLLKTQPNHL